MANNIDIKSLYSMLDNLLTGVAFFELWEDKFEVLYMNNGAYRMLGYTPESGRKYVNNMISLIVEEDKPKFWQAIEDILKDDGAVDFEMRTVTASGSLRWLQSRCNLYEKTDHSAIIVSVFMDATDRKFVENEMRIQSEWYQVLLETEGEFLIDYNARTDVMTVKTAGKFGLENKKIIDRYVSGLRENLDVLPENRKILEIIEAELRSPRTDIVELKISLHEGVEKKWYRLNLSSVAGVDGYVTHIVGKITDIHEKRLLLEELREKEKLDNLTGWYNEEETKRQVAYALELSKETEVHAFILLDMSEFRLVYESLGEETGNYVIKEITKKIGKSFKRSDILGRVGKDEYVLFIQNIGVLSNLNAVVSRVSQNTSVTFGEGKGSVTVAGRVGVSVYPYQGSEWADLYLRAEKAVNSLKASGNTGYHIHNLSGIYQKEMAENERIRHLYEEVDTKDKLEDLLVQILCENKQTENLIRAMLKMIVRHYEFHKAYLSIGKVAGKDSYEYRYENPGYEVKEGLEERPKWFDFLCQLELLDAVPRIIHNYDPIPEELASYMIRNKMHTLFIQPMLMQGEINGVFVMAECTGREWRLNKAEEKEMKRILQLVQLYVLRYEKEQLGHAVLRDIRMLDNFDSYVLAIDYDTYELCFANRKMLDALPHLQLGDCCYRTFSRQETPCEMCIMKNLDRNDIHSKYSEERFCTPLRSWMKMHASWMQNDAESATCLLNSIDISEYFMGSNSLIP